VERDVLEVDPLFLRDKLLLLGENFLQLLNIVPGGGRKPEKDEVRNAVEGQEVLEHPREDRPEPVPEAVPRADRLLRGGFLLLTGPTVFAAIRAHDIEKEEKVENDEPGFDRNVELGVGGAVVFVDGRLEGVDLDIGPLDVLGDQKLDELNSVKA
jgi:hypothetical protein